MREIEGECSSSVSQLKTQLAMHGPESTSQNIIFEGRLLNDNSPLSGQKPVVVMLQAPTRKPNLIKKPAPPPTASEIFQALTAEAKLRGIPAPPPPPSSGHRSLSSLFGNAVAAGGVVPQELLEMDNQLMTLMEALEGRLGLRPQSLAGLGGEPSSEPLPPIVPPEPTLESVNSLIDMGFSNDLARKVRSAQSRFWDHSRALAPKNLPLIVESPNSPLHRLWH